MANSPTQWIRDFALPDATATAAKAKPSETEREVMRLFDEFRNPLLRYSLSFGLTIHDAEEISQEVFLSLFQHLQTGKSRRNLPGWLFRVAHNQSLKRRYANLKSAVAVAGEAVAAEQHLDSSPDPEEQMLFAQKRRRLLAVVRALPEEDQSCLRLRAEGLRYREIAAAAGMSLGAVSMSLARSLARLKRAEEG
jgi:RNA polymerase sigma-70 factor (ECF subfamily)